MLTPTLAHAEAAPDLQDYVQSYLFCEMDNPGVAQFVPAWTKNLLVIQFGDPIYATVGGKEEQRVAPVSLTGPTKTTYQFRNDGKVIRFFVVTFTDVGAFALTQTDLRDLVDSSVCLGQVMPCAGEAQLVEQLHDAHTFQERTALVDEYLRKLLPSGKRMRQIEAISQAAKMLQAGVGRARIEDVSGLVGLRPSWLRERFGLITGTSPKSFAEAVRANAAFNLVMDGSELSGAKLAALLHFHDQAHFIRAFKRYTGHTPGTLPKELFHFSRQFT